MYERTKDWYCWENGTSFLFVMFLFTNTDFILLQVHKPTNSYCLAWKCMCVRFARRSNLPRPNWCNMREYIQERNHFSVTYVSEALARLERWRGIDRLIFTPSRPNLDTSCITLCTHVLTEHNVVMLSWVCAEISLKIKLSQSRMCLFESVVHILNKFPQS